MLGPKLKSNTPIIDTDNGLCGTVHNHRWISFSLQSMLLNAPQQPDFYHIKDKINSPKIFGDLDIFYRTYEIQIEIASGKMSTIYLSI